MKTLRLLMLAATTAALFSFVLLRAAGDFAQADVARLQGEWAMVSGSADGNPVPEMMLETGKRVCTGNETKVTVNGQLILQATFTLDPTKSPKTIDYIAIDGPTKGRKHFGIYEFEGDTVRFCFGEPDGARPTEFSTKAGDRRTLSVWKKK